MITAIAAGAGFIENPRRHEKLRLPSQAIVPVSVVLLALAVLHVFRGVGTVGGKC